MGRALIVSAGASSNEYIAARLTEMGYSRPVIIPSGAEARRRMMESDFELIVVNSPLPDEFGHEVCINAVEKTDAGVVFLVKAAQAEQLLGPFYLLMQKIPLFWNLHLLYFSDKDSVLHGSSKSSPVYVLPRTPHPRSRVPLPLR